MKAGQREMHGGPRRAERGQNLVEFALVVPVLLLFLFAIFEFGNMFRVQLQLQNAVRDGARYAALNGCPANSAVQTKVQNAAGGLNITTTVSYSPVTCVPTDPATCLSTTNPIVSVTGTYTYTAITPLGSLAKFFGQTLNNSLALSATGALHNEC